MIKTEIKAVVDTLPGEIQFLYGTKDEINVAADKVPATTTVVCLYPMHPATLDIDTKNGSIPESYEIYMEFQLQTKFENNSDDNAATVKAMLLLAKKFLAYAREFVLPGSDTRLFEFVKGATARAFPVYANKDKNMCGVSLTFNVKLRADEYLLNC